MVDVVRWPVYVDILLTSDSSVVLVRDEGEEVRWRLPGAFLPAGVQPDAWAQQVAREQAGMDAEWLDLVWAEVRDEHGQPVLVLHYTAEATAYPEPGGHIAEARLFQAEHLPHLSDADRDALYRTLTGG